MFCDFNGTLIGLIKILWFVVEILLIFAYYLFHFLSSLGYLFNQKKKQIKFCNITFNIYIITVSVKYL